MRKLTITALLLALCMLLFACGSSEDDIETGTSDTNSSADSTDSSTETEATLDAYHECVGTVTSLADVSSIPYTLIDTTVTDEEVEEDIEDLLLTYPNYAEDETKADAAVADGDVICLDYTGYLDGEAFDGGSAEAATLEIGSGSFVGDFEDQMIGHKKGDSFTIDVTFPDDYTNNEDLAGKTTQFDITINYICKEAPADDAWISDLTSGTYETIDDYREYVRTSMEESLESEAESQKYSDILTYLQDNSEFEVAQEDLDYYYEYLYDYYYSYCEYYGSMYGLDTETMISYSYGDMETFEAEVTEQSESMAIEYTLLQAVEKQENITLSDEKRSELLSEYMDTAGMTDETEFLETYGEDYVTYVMRMDVVWDYLEEHAVGVEATEEETATEE